VCVCVCVWNAECWAVSNEKRGRGLFPSILINSSVSASSVSTPVNLSEFVCICVCVCVCVCVCLLLTRHKCSHFSSQWASVLWPGFILHKEHPPLQLESSLWPWQTVVCQESTRLELFLCYWLQWIELSMCWHYWNPLEILAGSRGACLLLPCMCVHSVSYHPCSL